MGRVRGVAAGARRPKSRFGSTLERMSYVHIWFFERENRELVRVNQCELIESFVDVFKDYAAGVALAVLAEITEAVLPDREAADPVFRLLLLSAQAIKRNKDVDLPLAYFALWTVRLGGWLGSLERCARCGKDLAGSSAHASRSVPGIFCGNCRGIGMKPISAGARNAGIKLLAERLDKIEVSSVPKAALRELSRYLLDLIEHQIERKLVSREMLETAL